MTTETLPWLGDPLCDWYPPRHDKPCGQVASWYVTTHDFDHEISPDPDSVRVWTMCAGCAHRLLSWAKTKHAAGEGSFCRGCNTLITPMLGGFLRRFGEIAYPEKDTSYER